jgi:glycosyl transferase family 25
MNILTLIIISCLILILTLIIICIIFKPFNEKFKVLENIEKNRYIIPLTKKLKYDIKIHGGDDTESSIDKNRYNILIDGESWNSNDHYSKFDLVITTVDNMPNTIYCPFYSQCFMDNKMSKYTPIDLFKKHNRIPEKFCIFMYSNCDENFEGVKYRNEFFDILDKYRNVDSLGKCKNNKINEKGGWVESVDTYKDYKFVISFENSIKDGYITEKIITPFLSGSIPIYLGCPKVVNHFNPERFINVRDFENFDMCAKYIISLTDKDILNIIRKPVFKDNKLNSHFGWFTGSDKFYNRYFDKIFEQPYIRYTPLLKQKINWYNTIKVINLDVDKERMNDISIQFRKYGVNFDRFPAIIGKDYYNSRFLDINKNIIKPGELGIVLSAMEILNQLLLDDNCNYYIIMEDDVILDQNINQYESIISNAPCDWNIIFLGVNKSCKQYKTKNYSKIETFCCPGAFAYAINKSCANYLLNFVFPLIEPLDIIFQNSIKNLNIYTYDIVDVVYQTSTNSSTSNINYFSDKKVKTSIKNNIY